MIIVGLTGDIGSGKTTFADFLGTCAPSSRHLESSELITEVANDLRSAHGFSGYPPVGDFQAMNEWLAPLPQILHERVHVDVKYPQLALDPSVAATQPELYQKLFAYLEKLTSTPAIRTGEITVENKNEHRTLLQWLGGYLPHRIDGRLWYRELVRRARQTSVQLISIGGVRYPADAACVTDAGGFILQLSRPHLAEKDLQDITERERARIKPGATIHNDGGLDDLQACAAQVWRDLRQQALKREYFATPQ